MQIDAGVIRSGVVLRKTGLPDHSITRLVLFLPQKALTNVLQREQLTRDMAPGPLYK